MKPSDWHCDCEMQEVIDALEEDLRLGRFTKVDEWFVATDPSKLYPATVLAALTITLYGKEYLTQRAAFLVRAEATLVERLGAERASKLLERRR